MNNQNSNFCAKSVLLASLLCFIAPLSIAQESPRWFEIEVIVFKQNNADLSEELWDKKAPIIHNENQKDIFSQLLYPEPKSKLKALENAKVDFGFINNGESLNNESSEAVAAENASSNETLVEPTNLNETTASTEIITEPFSSILAEELKLTAIFDSLTRSSRYTPVNHFGWRQPVLAKSANEWVRIVGGEDYSDRFDLQGKDLSRALLPLSSTGFDPNDTLQTHEKNPNELATDLNQPQFSVHSVNSNNTADLTELSSDGPLIEPQYFSVPEIDGAIQVYLGRYLHINTQLYLRQPGEVEQDLSAISSSLSNTLLQSGEQNSDVFESGFNWSYQSDSLFQFEEKETVKLTQLINYPMIQSRRVRSNETHYFDHPLFGLIIQIRPFEPLTIETNQKE